MHPQWIISAALVALLLLVGFIGVFNKATYPESFKMPLGAALRLNAWALVAIVVSFVARWCLKQPDWAPALRVLVALAPVLPSVLYAHGILRWIRGLDELQRRIQYEAMLFATATMGLLFMVLDLLQSAGCLISFRWGWEGFFALAFGLLLLGSILSNRHYR